MEEHLVTTVIPHWNSPEAARFKETFNPEFVDMITRRLSTLYQIR